MRDWLDSLAGPEYVPAILWTAAALIAFVIVLLIVRIVRRMTFGTFVAGGRNRKNRLAVMDATAVDSHRRLVLVRRDDVEHLLLIGGPTDVVVEQDIRLLGQPRRPAEMAPPTQPQARPRPVESAPQPQPQQQRPQQPARQPQPAPAQPVVVMAPQQQVPARAREVQTDARPAPRGPAAPAAPAVVAQVRPQPAARPRLVNDDIDDALLKELETSLDGDTGKKPAKRADVSLEDEMTKLLGELSNQKR